MSTQEPKNKKNNQPPNRPKGVREADKERTGFIVFNPNEKDPLLELFDTLQTVKEKNEQQKEKSHSENNQNRTQFILSNKESSLFKLSWVKAFASLLLIALSIFSWIQYPEIFKKENRTLPPPVAVTPPILNNSAVKTPDKKTILFDKLTERVPAQTTLKKERPKTKTPEATLKPLPRQQAGSFFPEEDPGDITDDEDSLETADDPEPSNDDPYEEEYTEVDDYEDTADARDATDSEKVKKPTTRKKKSKKDADPAYY